MKRLPPEIVGLIHGHLDPLSTFHLTLACRQIAFHSQDALKLNRRRHEMYRTVSDQDKTAVSAILNDAAIGWHVRCLEFWNGDAIVADEDHAGDTLGVLTHSRSYTDSEELKDRIQSPNGLNHGENLKVQNALQTQLLLCCSRIQMLKQRRHAQTSTRIDQNTFYNDAFLCEMVANVIKLPQPVWPPSLTSLRQLAIGLPFPDDRGRAILTSKGVLPLFLLPNLETVYIRGLATTEQHFDEAEGRRKCNTIPSDSSSVQNVCLEAIFGIDGVYAICNIIRACRRLETLILSSCEIPCDFDLIPTELKQWQSKSIRTFFPCGDLSVLRSNRGALYDKSDMELGSLVVLPIDANEILLDVQFHEYHSGDKLSRREACEAAFDDMNSFTRGRETLVLHALGHTLCSRREDVEYVSMLDEYFASLVKPEDGKTHGVKQMYLDKAVGRFVSRGLVESRSASFPRTREAAERCGIRVYCDEGAFDQFGDEMCRRIFGVALAFDRLR